MVFDIEVWGEIRMSQICMNEITSNITFTHADHSLLALAKK